MEKSPLWKESVKMPVYPVLNGDISTEVAVIGGGLTGILTAHFLEQSGRKCVVLEADRVGGGQTGRTTAKVTSQHGLVYHHLIQTVGREGAKRYAAAAQNAILRYKLLIEKYGIDCDFRECPSYLYTKKQGYLLRREYRAVRELGIEAGLTKETELPFPVEQALCFPAQASFHPLKFLAAISEDLKIYEKTKVLKVMPGMLMTDRGRVRAEKIVFACHYPFVNMPGYYFMRMHQERSYVVALKGAARLDGMYLGIDEDGASFRSAEGGFLLLGGGGHRTGTLSGGRPYEYLIHEAESYWPGAKAAAGWSAQDCMPLDKIPYIGRFAKHTPDWYVASGFKKWGMTSAMTAALLLTDLICGRETPYEKLFSPQRKTWSASVKSLAEEGKYAVGGLWEQKMVPAKGRVAEVRPGQGEIVQIGGQKRGVYKDEKGKAYMVSVKCPHLGCQLAWNQAEKSWDCPCHGSRFDCRGRLLDGPAQTGVEV